MSTFLTRLRKDTSGNVMAIFAASLISIVGFAGGALDASIGYLAKSRLQKACDAGVMAGRQSMDGSRFRNSDRQRAEELFEFNFPDGLYDAQNVTFEVEQNPDDDGELLGSASADVPTNLMFMFGHDTMDLEVNCDAQRDMGNNDIVLVLDVTGSMNNAPSNGGGKKIERLRAGTIGLYRAFEDVQGWTTRSGIVPYSHTVNVGRSLKNDYIMADQEYVEKYVDAYRRTAYRTKIVPLRDSTWGEQGAGTNGNKWRFRISGDACIEERPSVGNAASPIRINDTITLADVNEPPRNGNDSAKQFGRYDPGVQEGMSQVGCPSEASPLREYDTETEFQSAIAAATNRVTGGTYHDVGMLWGLRFISRNGFFSADNPVLTNGSPIQQHIIFMTDGRLETGDWLYSADGVQIHQGRMQGPGALRDKHIKRFESSCDVAKSMGVTVWVIALDVTDVDSVRKCATRSTNFFISDGSDLEDIFAEIGRGIGNLRLTR